MPFLIRTPTPFSSTKDWRDFLARMRSLPSSPEVEDAIGVAETELQMRSRHKRKPYWEPDPPAEEGGV